MSVPRGTQYINCQGFDYFDRYLHFFATITIYDHCLATGDGIYVFALEIVFTLRTYVATLYCYHSVDSIVCFLDVGFYDTNFFFARFNL